MDEAPSRSALPVPDQMYAGPPSYDASDPKAVFEPIRPIEPPDGAPNVLVVLLDDVGFDRDGSAMIALRAGYRVAAVIRHG